MSAATDTTAARPTLSPLLTAPPGLLLLRMASPSALAFLVQAGVTLAETAFVAQLGLHALAAMALMLPALMLMQMLANGAIGGAVASAIARALGRGDRSAAAGLLWHAIAIAIAAGVLFSAIYGLWGAALLTRTGAPAEVTALADAYGTILFAGTVPVWLSALLNAAVRGTGDMRYPARLMIISSLIQVPLSGCLMLGWLGLPALGLAGAAVAVIVIATLNTVILIVRFAHPERALRLSLDHLVLRARHLADIFRVGALAAASPVFTVLTIMLLNGLIGRFGVETLAGYGIVARIEFLLVPLVFGIGAAMTTLVGTNVGAGQLARAERIGWIGGGAAAALTGAAGLLLALWPGLWVALFTDDPESFSAGAQYLQLVGPAFAFQGLGLALYFASQGAGRVAWPIAATILRFIICVGGAWWVVRAPDPHLGQVYACIAAGMVCYGGLTALALWRGAWRTT